MCRCMMKHTYVFVLIDVIKNCGPLEVYSLHQMNLATSECTMPNISNVSPRSGHKSTYPRDKIYISRKYDVGLIIFVTTTTQATNIRSIFRMTPLLRIMDYFEIFLFINTFN